MRIFNLIFAILIFSLLSAYGTKRCISESDVVWNTPSKDFTGSMPIGNGNIGLNVWVEPSGDLLFYIGQTEAFDENAILMKLAKIRITTTPSFPVGIAFEQRLNLSDGSITISAGKGIERICFKLWVDANNQVIRVESEGNSAFHQTVALETWRDQVKHYTDTQVSDLFKNLSGSDLYNTYIYPDTLEKIGDKQLRWFHHNKKLSPDPYEVNMKLQLLDGFIGKQQHPLLGRTFGGLIEGDNYRVDKDNFELKTINAVKNNSFSIYIHSKQVDNPNVWRKELDASIKRIKDQNYTQNWKKHVAWWSEFWNRSYIYLRYNGTDPLMEGKVSQLNRAYALCRFLNACGGRGYLPIKFNGSLFCYGKKDNPDWRLWGGPGFWFQNERLCYWNMFASGDFDLLKPWFNFYHSHLELAKYRTKLYFKHEGAYFSEAATIWGSELSSHYGWTPFEKRPSPRELPTCTYVRRHWQNGLESLLMMIDYYNYTGDKLFLEEILLPHAEAVTLFYDQHYDRRDGKIYFSPAQSIEQWHIATNPLPEIAGLKYVLPKLLTINSDKIDEKLKLLWNRLLTELPAVPTRVIDGKKILSPADTYSAKANLENPEMYAVFPYKLYGLNKPDLDMAIETQRMRCFKSHVCWSQDDVQYALLGQVPEVVDYLLQRASFTPTSESRFPVFWNEYCDGLPDIDHGGNLMLALQYMLLQAENDEIYVFPSWPQEWDVEFKLHAPKRTVIEGSYKGGKVRISKVTPLSRKSDIKIGKPKPGLQ